MKDFSSISNEILKGIHIKENPSKNEKSRNEGILKGIHIKENLSRNEKSRNEGILFNFQFDVKKEVIQRKIHPKMKEIQE